MKNITFQYFTGGVYISHPAGIVTLEQFIEATRNPKPATLEVLRKIAVCTDPAQKLILKQSLPYFTPCVYLRERRNYENIERFTGLLVVDIDKIDNANEIKHYIFNTFHSVFCCYLSPSKRGVKAIFRIPTVQTPDQFKAYFYGVSDALTGLKGFDTTAKNCVLPLFLSYDPEILIRPEPGVWQRTGIDPANFTNKVREPVTPGSIEKTSETEELVLKIIKTGLDVNSDGHPKLRALCYTVGGYIASGYIDENKALDEIEKIIENSYFSKGTSGYKRTARTAINAGKSEPLKHTPIVKKQKT